MELDIVYNDNVFEAIKKLPDNSIDCVVTSPPYYGLRKYSIANIFIGGKSDCDHTFAEERPPSYRSSDKDNGKNPPAAGRDGHTSQICIKCDAYFGELGLEADYYRYVQHLVLVFKEVLRALKPEGSFWLNIGDTYFRQMSSHRNGIGLRNEITKGSKDFPTHKRMQTDCKSKDLIGIPWRVAFALRDIGFYLRSDIIWHKPNSMPESVKDRPTRSHEHIFLLTKSSDYFFDTDAIRTPYIKDHRKQVLKKVPENSKYNEQGICNKEVLRWPNEKGAQKRDVWKIPTAGLKESHIAPFPKELVRTCIKAGCKKGGVVLDPFMGSGTTALVAIEENCHFIGYELSKKYAKIAQKRISKAQPSLLLE